MNYLKKYYLIILFITIFCYSNVVYADTPSTLQQYDYANSYTTDDNGDYISLDGRLFYGKKSLLFDYGDPLQLVNIVDSELELQTDGNYTAGYVAFYMPYDSGTRLIGWKLSGLDHAYCTYNPVNCKLQLYYGVLSGNIGNEYSISYYNNKYGSHDFQYVYQNNNDISSHLNRGHDLICESSDNNPENSNRGGCTTTFPVFLSTDTDGISSYLLDNDYSKALNYSYLQSQNIVETDLELPQGLTVTGGYSSGFGSDAYSLGKDLQFNWYQTVDTTDYIYDIDMCLEIGTVTKTAGIGGASAVFDGNYYSSGWVDMEYGWYKGITDISKTYKSDVLDDLFIKKCWADYKEKTGNDIPYKGYMISKFKVRIRNVEDNRASNFVVMVIDKNGVGVQAHVEDAAENIVEDDIYNDTEISDIDSDSLSSVSVSNNIDNLLVFIRNGFGLIGNGGVISLMGSCFSYLPSSIWVMLKFLVAMTVSISVLKLVKDFIF